MSPRSELSRDFAGLSPIVAGCWRICGWCRSPRGHLHWIEGCIEPGIDSFDHADIYGDYPAEARFGVALALQPALRAHPTGEGKCGIKLVSAQHPAHRLHSYDTSTAYPRLRASVENSLRALHCGTWTCR